MVGVLVSVAVKDAAALLVPVGPPPKFAEVLLHEQAEVLVCKPCAEARGISAEALAPGCKFGGMKDYLAHVGRDDCKSVSF